MFDQNGDMTNKSVIGVWAIFYIPATLFLIHCLSGAYNDEQITGFQFFMGLMAVIGYGIYRLIILIIEMFFLRKLGGKVGRWLNN